MRAFIGYLLLTWFGLSAPLFFLKQLRNKTLSLYFSKLSALEAIGVLIWVFMSLIILIGLLTGNVSAS